MTKTGSKQKDYSVVSLVVIRDDGQLCFGIWRLITISKWGNENIFADMMGETFAVNHVFFSKIDGKKWSHNSFGIGLIIHKSPLLEALILIKIPFWLILSDFILFEFILI